MLFSWENNCVFGNFMKMRLVLYAILGFFAIFLFYPIIFIFLKAFFYNGRISFSFFQYMFTNSVLRECITNSFFLAVVVTFFTAFLSLPLAFITTKFDFKAKAFFSGLLLLPMIMPPFVGAIGMRQMLARFGSINLLLMKIGLINQPLDFLAGGGFWAVVFMEVLHLYPLMFLNLSASMANIDPSLEEQAQNLGANGWKMLKTITFPLLMPGLFAGASIVFIWSFTDLGTPLIFEYTRLVPVQIFNMVTDIGENPMGYALVVVVVLLTLIFFLFSKFLVGSKNYEMLSKGQVAASSAKKLKGINGFLCYVFLVSMIFISLLPHLSVFLTSISDNWFMSILPKTLTAKYYGMVFSHPLTVLSIKNSIFLSTVATILDVILGLLIAYILARSTLKEKSILDVVTMLPLAIPGLILAFGYVACFSSGPLDVRNNPFPLLVIAYTIRRVPYVVRSVYAGFQQTSVAFEEASLNLGASVSYTFLKITSPLIAANIIAGAILSFSFAMLEVSDSLILAMKEQFYPITKAIYVLVGRISDGSYMASALGVLGMLLLAFSLFFANKILGKKMGQIFRI